MTHFIVMTASCVIALLTACGGQSTSAENAQAGRSHASSGGNTSVTATGGGGNRGGTTSASMGGSGSTSAIGGANLGGTTSGGTGGMTSSGTAGKAGSTVTGGSAGRAGSTTSGGSTIAGNGTTGGNGACPAIKCAAACPEGTWVELDGCSSCACSPPKTALSDGTFVCPSASLSLAAASRMFIGGIDRWLFDFTWICSAGVSSLGQPLRATLEVGIIQSPPTTIDASNETYFYPNTSSSTSPYELPQARAYVAGSGIPEIEIQLTATSSFISIRRQGDRLVGGIQYVGKDSANNSTITLAGAFDVAVPTM
jgi:hypothetical protein